MEWYFVIRFAENAFLSEANDKVELLLFFKR
jgi:hypothetical protein